MYFVRIENLSESHCNVYIWKRKLHQPIIMGARTSLWTLALYRDRTRCFRRGS